MATSSGAVGRLELWPADFYVACAAGAGDQRAILAVDKDYLIPSSPSLRRLGATADEIEEALQTTRERLFVGPNARIRRYSAASPLKQWVQLIAMRTAIDLRRARRGDREIVGAGIVPDPTDPRPDPASLLLKRTYLTDLAVALKIEIGKLPARDRTILKLHLLEGVTVEKIAQMRAVHRVTVARWIWKASEAMLDGVRNYFLTHHGLIPGECDSLVNLMRSQLSLDWARLFDDCP